MTSLTFDRISWLIDGQPRFLHSGELHYFRVPRRDWKTRMELLKAAGGNCLATYVPWLLHEPEEGRFVFDSDDGQLDFEAFLETAREVGLYAIVRPGPYQYSELINDGVPLWLTANYPELLARTFDGEVMGASVASYLHPLFLEKTRAWFNQVAPRLARHTLSRGGAVAGTQLDNELVGIQEWRGHLDYHPVTMGFGDETGRYPRFLRRKYGTVAALNAAYGSEFPDFAAVRPLKPVELTAAPRIRRAKDYFDCYLAGIAEYTVVLREMLRAGGLDTLYLHNAANPNMNSYFMEAVAALGDGFLLGTDNYYNLSQSWPQNNPTPQYAVRTFYSLETLRLLGMPPTVLEMPSGSLADWPPCTPHEAKACYWTHLAMGAKGANFYIFSGGANRPGTGTTSDVYDFSAPVGPAGEVRPLYGVQQEFGAFLAARPWLNRAERQYDVRCLLNLEYCRSWNYWQGRGDCPMSNPEAHEFLLKGVLSTAFCAGLSPRLCHADADDWVADTATPLIVVSSSSMSAAIQNRLIRHLGNGGNLLLLPVIPTLDENLQPCTLLADYLGGRGSAAKKDERIRLDIAGVANVYNNGGVCFAEPCPAQATVVGCNVLTRQPVAWNLKTSATGQATFLGFHWVQAMREHERMLKTLLLPLGLRQCIETNNPNVWATLYTAPEGRAVLYLLNLLASPMEVRAAFRAGPGRRTVDAGTHSMAPLTVKVVEFADV